MIRPLSCETANGFGGCGQDHAAAVAVCCRRAMCRHCASVHANHTGHQPEPVEQATRHGHQRAQY